MYIWVVRIDGRPVIRKPTKEEASLHYIKYKMLFSETKKVTLTFEQIP